MGSFTTKLQECRKTSTHRKKIFLLPLSHSDESGDNLPSLFKKGKEGLDPARASDLFLSFFSIVVCKYMEEISIGSLFPMVVISFFLHHSRYATQCLKISLPEYIIYYTIYSHEQCWNSHGDRVVCDKDCCLLARSRHQQEKWNSILQRAVGSQTTSFFFPNGLV